jgi:hypothetical protein
LRAGILVSMVMLAAAGLAAAGCGDDGDPHRAHSNAADAGGSTGHDDDEDGGAAAAPLYVLHTRVSSADFNQQSSYLVAVSSIEHGTTFDLDRAVELDATDVGLVGMTGSPYVYAGSCSEPIVTRFEVHDDGTFTKGPKLSFANLGVSQACLDSRVGLHSATKAYFAENQAAEAQVVVWNPSTMEIEKTIALPDVGPEGKLLPLVNLFPSGDRLFVVVSWQESFDEDYTYFGDHVRLIVIDTKTDEVISQSDDPRCNELVQGSSTSGGTLYLSPYSGDTPIRSILGDEHGVDSCGLRVVPPGKTFDQGYEVDLAALAGGRPAGDLVLVSDDVAFIHVWHSELVDPIKKDLSNWEEATGQNGFLWWRWPLGATKAERIPDQKPGNYTIVTSVDGRKFFNHWSDDFTSTTLEELTPDGTIVPSLSGPGQLYEVVRVY